MRFKYCFIYRKLICGIVSGSSTILADSLNNLADAGTSVMSLFGFMLAGAGLEWKERLDDIAHEITWRLY